MSPSVSGLGTCHPQYLSLVPTMACRPILPCRSTQLHRFKCTLSNMQVKDSKSPVQRRQNSDTNYGTTCYPSTSTWSRSPKTTHASRPATLSPTAAPSSGSTAVALWQAPTVVRMPVPRYTGSQTPRDCRDHPDAPATCLALPWSIGCYLLGPGEYPRTSDGCSSVLRPCALTGGAGPVLADTWPLVMLLL